MRIASLAALCAGLALPLAAIAQDSVTQFRFVADPGNISGCIQLEPGLERVHTLTVRGGNVDIESAGGIGGRMKLVRPNVYEEVFELSGVRLDTTADFSTTPPTVNLVSNNLGCKFKSGPV
jgi:hypothetical protein